MKRSIKRNKSRKKDGMNSKITLKNLAINPNHDDYYIVDANMIISYMNNNIKYWNDYVDFMSTKGPRFFVTPRIAKEVTRGPIPKQFVILRDDYDFNDIDLRVDYAYKQLLLDLNIPHHEKFVNDAKWLLECGYCMSINEYIPVESLFKNEVFAITSNAGAIRRFIKNPLKRKIFETAVDNNGLEHLITIRTMSLDGSFVDYS